MSFEEYVRKNHGTLVENISEKKQENLDGIVNVLIENGGGQVVGNYEGKEVRSKFVLSDNEELDYVLFYAEGEPTVVADSLNRENTEIHFLGTTHTSKKSAEEAERLLEEGDFDSCMVELDNGRYESMQRETPLLSPLIKFPLVSDRMITKIGAPVFVALGSVHTILRGVKKIIGSFGIRNSLQIDEGGIETAYKRAEEREDMDSYLIDKDMSEVVSKIMKEGNVRKGGVKVLASLCLLPITLGKSLIKRKTPNLDPMSLMDKVEKIEKEYPVAYENLIELRNNHMVNNILRNTSADKEEKVLVVVGAGHVEGMKELLDEHNFKSIDETIIKDII